MKKEQLINRGRRIFGAILTGVMMFSMIPAVQAAESMSATLGDKDEFTFVFGSGYEAKKDGDNENYHVASDSTVTISFTGDASIWLATYVPADPNQGGYEIESDAKKPVTIKYFENLEKADKYWDENANGDTLPVYDKTGGSVRVDYPGSTGDIISNTILISFDSTGSVEVPPAPQEEPKAQVVPETPAAPAAKVTSTFRTTDGLNSVIPPLPVSGQDLRYTVQPRETLYGIAYNYYGSMSKSTVDKIWNANADYFKSTRGILEAGAVITLPAKGLINPVTVSGIPNAAGAYLVNIGDNTVEIAKHFYGNGNLWRQVYEANKDRVKMIGNSPMIYDKQWLLIPNVDGSQYAPTQAPANSPSNAPSYNPGLFLRPGQEG